MRWPSGSKQYSGLCLQRLTKTTKRNLSQVCVPADIRIQVQQLLRRDANLQVPNNLSPQAGKALSSARNTRYGQRPDIK